MASSWQSACSTEPATTPQQSTNCACSWFPPSPQTLLVQPLEDVSAITGLQHPHRFLSPSQEQAARQLAQAAELLQPLPPGWELLYPAMEGYGASVCIVPPPGAQMQALSLGGGLRLALADVSLEGVQGIVQLAADAVGSPVQAALQLLQEGIAAQNSASVVQAVETLQQAAKAAEEWVLDQ